jgi:hypothetical protein
MSYSVHNNRTAVTDLKSEVASKIEEVPEGPGHDEAVKHQPVIDAALDVLTADIGTEEVGYSISGSAGNGYATLAISLQPAHD